MARRERRGGDGRHHDGRSQPDAPEERNAGLVRCGKRHGRDGAGLVQHHLRRIDSRKLGDEGQESVPERERVTGMQTAVRELVHRADVQRAERVELAHAAEMEKRIPVHDAGDVPQHDPQHEPEQGDHQRVPGGRAGDDAKRERQRCERDDAEHDERDPDRGVHEEDDGECERQRRERPPDRDRRAAQPERTGDEGAGEQEQERRGHEAQPESSAMRR